MCIRDSNSSKQALDLGVSMIHQELHPIRFRPVMENIWLGRFPMKGIAVDKKAMIQMTKDLFQEVGLDVDPEVLAGELSASTLQLVEMCIRDRNQPLAALAPALMLTGLILLGLLATFAASRLLSLTILRGTPSSFTLELPPYRKPQFGQVLLRSVFDRTLFVLGRDVYKRQPLH